MKERERVLIMGPPGSGKTFQLLKIAEWVHEDLKKPVGIIDLEDKISAFLESTYGEIPKWMNLKVAVEREKSQWETLTEIVKSLGVPPEGWILVDRMDLSWPAVQRWYTRQKYDEELADRMLAISKSMKKAAMFTPRFDQGAWQVINEAYESCIMGLLYKARCNVVFTTGIRGVEENSPQDIFGNLGVSPRGQKEIGHQPHSVFLLLQRRVGKDLSWEIITAKDLPNRERFDVSPLFNFAQQYFVGTCGLGD